MKAVLSALLFLSFASTLLTSCREEDEPTPSNGSGTPWTSYPSASVDSAFIQAPNVVTPNADGINDVFFVSMLNVTSAQTTIENLDDQTVFSSTSLYPVWDDLGEADLGRYRVQITAMSVSGHPLTAQRFLDLVTYDGGTCISYSGSPATGDQFDPRTFGITYPSNDIFCD